jgi:hypothetical protein
MLTEFFMERAEIVLAADARGFIGTVPEFPEVRVEAPTPDACERRLREEIVRALEREALESPACSPPADRAAKATEPHLSSLTTAHAQPLIKITIDGAPACPSCGTTGLPTAFHFCGLCGHKL